MGRQFQRVKASAFKKPVPVKKPQCYTHEKEMVYMPARMVWACVIPGCLNVRGVDVLGNSSEPSILKGRIEYLVIDGVEHIYFPDNMVVIPIESLPDDAVVWHNSNDTVKITMTLTKRVINPQGE